MSTLALFKTLADETRLRLLAVLSVYELNVNELVSLFGMGQSRISRHLKILSDSGLLEFRREGLWVFYSLPKEGEAKNFWLAIEPFVKASSEQQNILKSDCALASGIVQERAIKARHFFNSIAEDWDDISREILTGFDLPSAIMELVPQHEQAVDLGCGTGHMLERLLEKSCHVIGVDGSPRMLEFARRRLSSFGERVSLRIGELEHLPLANQEVDFALISMVLHHLEDPTLALNEIRRVLKPDASLIIADFSKHASEYMRSKYGDRWLGFELDFFKNALQGFSIQISKAHRLDSGLEIFIILAKRQD